mgnify:CR=1 FL=1
MMGDFIKQRTIKHAVMLEGIGLHSGKLVTIEFLPAQADNGIVFYRSDIVAATPIPAHYQAINDTLMSSNLVNVAGERVGTIEHLMSAIAALGIDNLDIRVSAAEIPIMDGSAMPFLHVLHEVGIYELNMPKKFIKVLKPVKVTHEDKFAMLAPNASPLNGFEINFQIAFDHPAFIDNNNPVCVNFSSQNFANDIAPARTFGFTKDIDYLKNNNLGLGGSMENAIVIDDNQVLNPEGLRFADEFVRHKILDAVGDLYLAGHQLLGVFTAFKSGHALNNALLKALLAKPENYEIVTFYDNVNAPISYFH